MKTRATRVSAFKAARGAHPASCILGPLLLLACLAISAHANPVGPSVAQGTASFTSQGSHLTVQASDHAFINWQSFNIGLGETTSFLQPSSSSVVWNRINDSNPSQILGNLYANGYVFLQNSSGFYVGGQASIAVHGLLMTTAPFPSPELLSGGAWSFNAPPPTASIINYGQINLGRGGSAFLIAHDIENRGTITAPEGNIGLFAGKEVLISERPDGRGLSAKVNLPDGSVDNSGRLVADAGTIAMHAEIVNQGGLIQANSVREVNGSIELFASDAVNLASGSVIQASGDSHGTSPGGSVVIKSDNSFADQSGSLVNVAGGAQAGNGGQVDISAPQMSTIESKVEGNASPGWLGGRLVIDPQNIVLSSTGSSAPTSGIVGVNDPPSSGALTLNVNSFSGMSQIDLQASQDITVATPWNLAASSDPHATLTLEAGRNILLSSGAFINAGQNWSLNLFAGVDFTKPPGTVSFAGNIDLTGITGNGSGSGGGYFRTVNGTLTALAGQSIYVGRGNLQTSSGALDVTARQNVTIGTGAIRTIGGGNIDVTATSGSVNAGTGNGAYVFNSSAPGYQVNLNGLTGISSGAGGDVTISAGQDVISDLPVNRNTTDAGSGAFGSKPGVVTVNAGRNVYGHFVAADSERNGQDVSSTINAGLNAGATGQMLALSLVRGGWTVNAPNGSIILQEVRNPNGVFNTSTASLAHSFDYDPGSFLNLNAGQTVEITGSNLPRIGTFDAVPVILPPSLSISAGGGGIQFDTSVILYPSPQGELSLATSGGGSLRGQEFGLTMSDSGDTKWTLTGSSFLGHAATPVQLNNPKPAVVDISGDMLDFTLFTPKETQITVHGNMDNCSFAGQNLHSGDNTYITVDGRLYNRNQATFDTLAQPLSAALGDELALPNFANSLIDANGNPIFAGGSPPTFLYTPSAASQPAVIAITGRMLPFQFRALVNTDANGNPVSLKPLYAQLFVNGVAQVDLTTGKPIADLAHPVSFLDIPTLTYLYNHSQDVPLIPATGYSVGGPGQFNVTAGSIDLGSSPGIRSIGPVDNLALTRLASSGAVININSANDLTMYSSTIATYLGGDINIVTGGSINVGTQIHLNGANGAQGIYTLGPGNIKITADGTVDVAGSRVATFNGGNISIESSHGDVNAGSGAQSDIYLTLYQIDPHSGALISLPTTFNGSGILTYTLPLTLEGNVGGHYEIINESPTAQPGNITISTPRGSIVSGEGGIVQEPLNGNESSGPTVTLTAGTHVGSEVVALGNIELAGSGVIGGTVNLDASGSITGLIIGRQDTTVNAVQNFSGTLLSGGTATLSAGGTASGTIIGISGISVGSVGSMNANLLSQNVSVGGAKSDAGLATTASASTTSQSAAQESSAQAKEQTGQDLAQTDDDEKKRQKKPVALAKRTGRVTVILPASN